uniref:serine-rich adhesin for platelets n=1 Tax=Osmia lignaria TaxID=473952 RepID=UPI001479157F|nr:serine-rich adhesin for platelets [Osmia lignaria]XP_034192213.1 serine-rich adhesin for platelets [Osmia lignaria]
MQPIQGGKWFVLMIVGSMALPPQSQTGKGKETMPVTGNDAHFDPSSTISSNTSNAIVASNSANNSVDIDINDDSGSTVSKPVSLDVSAPIGNDETTLASSSVTPILENRSSPDEIVENSPTTRSSIAGAESTSTTTTTTATTKSNVVTNAKTTMINGNNSNTGSSVAPTETSSRTIVSTQDASTFLSSSKKSTSSFNESTTTPASISAKETRESPGKIRPQIKLTTNYTSLTETGVRLPEGASAALAKPTKYHYYPHNQHIYLLPECAVQQVCNAVYVRLNFTQPLCACPGRYRDPCSASLDSDDLHTTELVTDPRTKALTLVKTCEPVAEMRECRAPRDWSLLALQNVRTGKSHYLVICRCPDANILEGPMSHDQPTYASVPGIRVYGMMCVQRTRRGRPLRNVRSLIDSPIGEINDNSMPKENAETNDRLSFPWYKVQQLMNTAVWD